MLKTSKRVDTRASRILRILSRIAACIAVISGLYCMGEIDAQILDGYQIAKCFLGIGIFAFASWSLSWESEEQKITINIYKMEEEEYLEKKKQFCNYDALDNDHSHSRYNGREEQSRSSKRANR